MRNRIHILAITMACLFYTMSCSDLNDKCKDTDCNNGECIEGVCHCDEGYIGDYCETRLIEKFYGIYDYTRACDSFETPDPRPIRIEDYNNAPDIMNIIALWGDPGSVAEATLKSNFSDFQILKQDFSFSWQIEGEGSMAEDKNTINLSFKIYDKLNGLKIDECQLVMKKQ